MMRTVIVAAAGLALAGCADMWGMGDQQEAAVVEQPAAMGGERDIFDQNVIDQPDQDLIDREWLLEEDEADIDPIE